ncbi:hypothetical protein SKAU_G00004170 [Synaphobranchus kaupii]|uniref:Uncharacterized protein n=1 Tax=Synaphobranchus kaupii TaxID=118154 RepID=A0A9Q1G8S3_SYNKA|nr:hypothetical protein SKAU_G00004170 [Synaphobranchus kaupii]
MKAHRLPESQTELRSRASANPPVRNAGAIIGKARRERGNDHVLYPTLLLTCASMTDTTSSSLACGPHRFQGHRATLYGCSLVCFPSPLHCLREKERKAFNKVKLRGGGRASVRSGVPAFTFNPRAPRYELFLFIFLKRFILSVSR